MGLCGVIYGMTPAAAESGQSGMSPMAVDAQSQATVAHEAGPGINTTRELWLFGGSLLDCPGLAQAPCSTDVEDGRQFALSHTAIEQLTREALWPEQRQNVRVLTNILLRRLMARLGSEPAPLEHLWHELAATYISRSGNDLSDAVARNGVNRYLDPKLPDPIVLRGDDYVASLSGAERNRINDYLSLGPLQPQHHSQDLLAQFLRQLQRRVPAGEVARLVLITAARDDAMGSANALLPRLQQTGIEVQWLPLDAALVQALAQGRCAELEQVQQQELGRYRLTQYYPERAAELAQFCAQPRALEARLSTAQGVLFLDGSVALLRASLQQADGRLYPWTRTLQQRHLRGELMVAAVGAAAQFSVGQRGSVSLPVMQGDNSESSAPLVQRWCEQQQCLEGHDTKPGLGLFPFGAVDTYTADRGREYRLLQASGANAGLGFGIDADTALQVRWNPQGVAELKVLGSGAVLLTDTRQSQYQAEGDRWQLRAARLSRLVPGSEMRLRDDGAYQLNQPDTHAGKPQQLLPPSRLVDPYFFRAWTQWFVANGLPYAEAEYHVYPTQALLRLQRPQDGLPFFSAANGLVGYRDLLIDLSFSTN